MFIAGAVLFLEVKRKSIKVRCFSFDLLVRMLFL